MVWLISFLTVSNIALGYGLAVYVQRQFGTALPSCGPLRTKKSEAPSAPVVVAEVPTVSPVVAAEKIKPAAAQVKEPEKTNVGNSPAPVPAEETSGLPPVDEENVLAGIEEFRSQLAKMNVAAEESAESAATEAEELAVAAD